MDEFGYTPEQMTWAGRVGALRAELAFAVAASPTVVLPDGTRRPVHAAEALAALGPDQAHELRGLIAGARVWTHLPARDGGREQARPEGEVCHNCAHGAHYHCDGWAWTDTVPTERVACECTGGPHYDPKEW